MAFIFILFFGFSALLSYKTPHVVNVYSSNIPLRLRFKNSMNYVSQSNKKINLLSELLKVKLYICIIVMLHIQNKLIYKIYIIFYIKIYVVFLMYKVAKFIAKYISYLKYGKEERKEREGKNNIYLVSNEILMYVCMHNLYFTNDELSCL